MKYFLVLAVLYSDGSPVKLDITELGELREMCDRLAKNWPNVTTPRPDKDGRMIRASYSECLITDKLETTQEVERLYRKKFQPWWKFW